MGKKFAPHGWHAQNGICERQVNEALVRRSIGPDYQEGKAGGACPRDRPGVKIKVLQFMSQIMLTALFALSISFLTFAASFAEVPRSEIAPSAASVAR